MLSRGEPQSGPTQALGDNRRAQSQTAGPLIMPGFIEVWFSPNGNTSGRHQREQASPCAKSPGPSGACMLGRACVGPCVHKAAVGNYLSVDQRPRAPGGRGREGCGLDKSRSPHPCSGRSSSQDVPAGGHLTSHVEGVLGVISSLALCGKGSWYKKFQGEMGWALGEDTARRLILWASQACSLAVFWRLSALHGINSREVSPTGVEAAGCGRRRKNKGEE